jgi:hypothetical protein
MTRLRLMHLIHDLMMCLRAAPLYRMGLVAPLLDYTSGNAK